MNKKMLTKEKLLPFTVGTALFAVCLFLGLCCGVTTNLLMCRMIVMALFALSLNFQTGYAGMGNLGHSLFFGLGGYCMMILITKFGLGLGAAILLTLILLVPFTLLCGYLTLQSSMLSFMFLTMSICLVISMLIQKSKWAGSTVGITYTIRPAWLQDPNIFYLVLLAVATVCVVAMYLLTRTTFIRCVVASRENEERLLFLGVDIRRLRIMVYFISSFFAGIAGILYAMFNNGVYTTSLDMSLAIQALLMCLIGGVTHFMGPIVGSVILTFITNSLSKYISFDLAMVGVIIILFVYFVPNGILNLHIPRREKHDRADAHTQPQKPQGGA